MHQFMPESVLSGKLYRLSAFTNDPAGGNPAGVWIGDRLPDAADMQQIAAMVGFSETAFVVPSSGMDHIIRYYSPEMEVPFCGHATIATGVLLGELQGEGVFHLETTVGPVPVTVVNLNGQMEASLTSVEPRHEPVPEQLLDQALNLLGWKCEALDPSIPPVRAYAGVWHLVLAAAHPASLATLAYDFEGLKVLMLQEGLTTLQLIWRENPSLYHSRNPFPVGGVVEDPATGASAAALGGYLRDAHLVVPPAVFTIYQGEAMGRPSRLVVHIPITGGIIVSGTAVHI